MKTVQIQPYAVQNLRKSPKVRFGQDSDAQLSEQTLVIQQSAQIEKMPDSLGVHFNVTVDGKSQDSLTKPLNQKTTGIVQALQDLKLPKLKIVTSPLSVQPDHSYDSKGNAKLKGYKASQSIQVVAKRISADDLSKYASKLVSLGLNHNVNLQGPNFFLANPEKLQANVIQKAIKAAKKLAQAAADAIGVKLGGVKLIDIGTNSAYRPTMKRSMATATAASFSAAPPAVSEDAFQAEAEKIVSPPVTLHFSILPKSSAD